MDMVLKRPSGGVWANWWPLSWVRCDKSWLGRVDFVEISLFCGRFSQNLIWTKKKWFSARSCLFFTFTIFFIDLLFDRYQERSAADSKCGILCVGRGLYLLLLIALLALNYSAGKIIGVAVGQQRKWALGVFVFINLMVLGFSSIVSFLWMLYQVLWGVSLPTSICTYPWVFPFLSFSWCLIL